MNTTFTKTISIKDVYGTDYPEIPKGYKALEFRPPKNGELYLNPFSQKSLVEALCETESYVLPNIIVTKIPDPVVIKGNVEYETKSTVYDIYAQDITIPEGYEFVDFRPPSVGEYFMPFNYIRNIDHALSNCATKNSGNARIILRKVNS